MVIYKRKKNSRLRGSTTHGWGSMKKHRGAGNRGGRGNAGSGKRGDAKKPSYWANSKYFGKHGFKNKNAASFSATSIHYLETKLHSLVASGKIKESNGTYVVDLEGLGFSKLLSQGKATKKFRITVSHASEKAVEKIRSAGGEVLGLSGSKKKEAGEVTGKEATVKGVEKAAGKADGKQ